MRDAGTLRRYVPLDVTEQMILETAAALVEEYPGLLVHGIVGDFERHLHHLPRPLGPRLVAFLGGTIGNFTPGSRRRFLRGLAKALGPEDHLLLGTDLVKDPAVIEAAYDDSAGRHRRVQPQRPARGQPRARRRLRRRRVRPRRVLRPRARVDRDAPARQLRASTSTSARSASTSSSSRARSCAPRSARSSRSSACEGDLAAAGLELEHVFTDNDGLFAALAVAARAALGFRACTSGTQGRSS